MLDMTLRKDKNYHFADNDSCWDETVQTTSV
jgi:hypothetical protein